MPAVHSSFYPTPREILTFAYIRLSDDNDGTMRSIDTQWLGIQRAARRFNVPIPPPERVFTDRDLSATDPNIVRFAYERMLKAIDAVDSRRYEVVVIAYAQDRIYRQPADWQHFTELVGPEECDGRLITDFEGTVDIGAMGIFAAGAGYVEGKKTAKRSKDGIHGAATEGKGHGQVPYGWKREYDHSGTGKPKSTTVIVEAEAAVVREAADRFLRGDSLRGICADFNARHISAPGAGHVTRRDPVTREALTWAPDVWLPKKLRAILLRTANKGIREHTSGKGARQTTTYHAGQWEAILTDAVFDAISARLSDPSRRTTTSNTAKYLLSGIAICGGIVDGKICGRPVKGRVSYRGKARTRYASYGCEKGHVVKSLAATENVVTSEVLHILSQPEIRALLTPRPDDDTREALAREADLIARRDRAADDYAEGRIPGEALARVTSNIEEQLKAIRHAIKTTQDVPLYSDLLASDPDTLEELWDSYSISYRRSIVKALFNVVLLSNSRIGKMAFDPSTISIELRPMKG